MHMLMSFVPTYHMLDSSDRQLKLSRPDPIDLCTFWYRHNSVRLNFNSLLVFFFFGCSHFFIFFQRVFYLSVTIFAAIVVVMILLVSAFAKYHEFIWLDARVCVCVPVGWLQIMQIRLIHHRSCLLNRYAHILCDFQRLNWRRAHAHPHCTYANTHTRDATRTSEIYIYNQWIFGRMNLTMLKMRTKHRPKSIDRQRKWTIPKRRGERTEHTRSALHQQCCVTKNAGITRGQIAQRQKNATNDRWWLPLLCLR